MTPTCPYCRTPFEAEDKVVTCPACGTVHHADCAQENGGCTVFGCSEAPAEELKVSVTSQDVSHPAGAPQSIAELSSDAATALVPARRVPLPPPPRPAGWVAPPPRPDAIEIRTGYVRETPSLGFAGYAGTATAYTLPTAYTTRKSRVVFVLMAVFFGVFGVHNFYAGYIKKAVIQLCLTLFTCFYGAIVVWIWAIVEACMINSDEDGVAFT